MTYVDELSKITELRADIERIGVALIKKADERDFCREFEDFITELNSTLTGCQLPMRDRRYGVNLKWMVDTTMYVSASSPEAARQAAIESLNTKPTRFETVDGIESPYIYWSLQDGDDSNDVWVS